MEELLNKFPVYTDRLKISLMDTESIDWYIQEVKQPRYYKYLNDKRIAKIDEENIRYILLYIINSYENKQNINNIRLVIYKDNQRCGSIILLNKINNSIELAYWISEKSEGNGIITESIISYLFK